MFQFVLIAYWRKFSSFNLFSTCLKNGLVVGDHGGCSTSFVISLNVDFYFVFVVWHFLKMTFFTMKLSNPYNTVND